MVSPVGSNRLPLRTYINTSKHEKNTHIYYGASEHFLRKHSRQGRAAAAQEMYVACSRFTSALDEMNSILAGVYNKQTADAAAAPLKAAAIEFFTQLQVIQGIEPDGPVDSATEQRIMALLAKAEKGQVTFQAHCERLGDNACYGSEKMIQALLFIGSLGEQI